MKNFINGIFILLTLSFSSLISCSNTKSDNVKTSGIHATFSVEGNNQNSVNCQATLQVGGATGTYLDLTSGDSVTCNGNSMSRSELLGIITYSATVPYQVGSTYTIVLTRTGENPYSSSVVLPEAISNVSPSSAISQQKGSAINVSWTPSSNATEDSFSASLSATGVSALLTDSPPEQGALGFGSTDTTPSPVSSDSSTGTLTYSRARSGTMATGLAGTIKAYQKTSVSVTLTN